MLSGDTHFIRDIGHARWRDTYAKLENQSSPEFKKAVAYEQAEWQSSTNPLKTESKEWTTMFESVYKHGLPQSPDYAQESYLWQKIHVHIQHALSHTLNVWVGETLYEGVKSFGTDTDSNHYFVIRDIGSGGEDLELAIYTLGESKPLYTIKHVGEHAWFAHTKLWYQTTENRLRTPSVYYTDIKTGNDTHLVYFDYDPRFQVELYQPAYDETIFIKRSNALAQQLGYIVQKADDFDIVWQTELAGDTLSGSLFPISKTIYGKNSNLEINNTTVKLPKHTFLMDAFMYKSKIYISVIFECVMNIYEFNPKTYVFRKLTHYTSPCTIIFHLAPNTKPRFAYHVPNQPSQIYELNTGGGDLHTLIQSFPQILELPYFEHGTSTAHDHAEIPYWYISHTHNPTRLIVSAYGAYGITAYAGYPLRWLPYLERGYALVVAAPRGGRDNGDEWYDGGRTALRKHTTFDDTAAVIQTVQQRFKLSPRQTIIYGRSAGGWLAAYIGLKYPNLVGAVYAEVPYLDVLRTTTNPALPLTQLEYDEFGDPIRRPEEFKALRAISPNNIVRRAPQHSPQFLVRTALHDAQVLPYEALKFGKHLRKNGWRAVIGLDMTGGHFTKPSSSAEIQGDDAAFLDQALSTVSLTAARSRTRSARSHWSNGVTRRRARSSRKHAIVH
jgi:protease II